MNLADTNHRLQLLRSSNLFYEVVVDATVTRCGARLIGTGTRFEEDFVCGRGLRRRMKMNREEEGLCCGHLLTLFHVSISTVALLHATPWPKNT